MKYIVIYFSFFFCLNFVCKAQNLVPNYSFEEYDVCPDDITIYSKRKLLPSWTTPSRGTTDYFNACTNTQVNVPDNIMGNMFALDGKAYAGIILIEKPHLIIENKKPLNYREYIQTELKHKLTKDKLYCVKFYFSIASYSTFSTNRIGAYLSKSAIRKRFRPRVLNYKPQIQLDSLKTKFEKDYWYQVCDTFRAVGNEKFLTIGNFYNDCSTRVEELSFSHYRESIKSSIIKNKLAYYYIDVVSVTELSDTTINCCFDKYLLKKN